MPEENKVVLIIDDDLGVRLLLEKFLSKEGYKVVLAASGEEGLTLFDNQFCQVVLLDISLGDITGVEVAKVMRARSRPSLKIIGITAYNLDVLEKHYPEAREVFNAFCFKPFSHRELMEILKSS